MDIKALVSRMTLEEKAGLCSGLDFWHTKSVERLGVPSVMVSDARMVCASRMTKGITWASMTASRLCVCRQPPPRQRPSTGI